jgi:hypothetical protein
MTTAFSFTGIQYVMMSTMFTFAILGIDLHSSLKNENIKLDDKAKRMLIITFVALFFFYVCEFFLTFGTIVSSICPVALYLIGFTHYSIKVIVAYSYTKRVDIALTFFKMRTSFATPKLIKRILLALQVLIWVFYMANLVKVWVTYKSFYLEGQCVFDLGSLSWLDEACFGVIDLLTLLVFAKVFFTMKTSPVANEKLLGTLGRVLKMSSITMCITIYAIILNVIDPMNSLTAGVIDISTDIMTLMRIYSSSSPKRSSSSAKRSASSVGSTTVVEP